MGEYKAWKITNDNLRSLCTFIILLRTSGNKIVAQPIAIPCKNLKINKFMKLDDIDIPTKDNTKIIKHNIIDDNIPILEIIYQDSILATKIPIIKLPVTSEV